MAAEASNPEFGFLFDLRAPDHAYYRWRLFSLASGDTLRAWRVEPFVMVEGGPRRAARGRPPRSEARSMGRGHESAARSARGSHTSVYVVWLTAGTSAQQH